MNLDALGLCRKELKSRSKFTTVTRKCHLPDEHSGNCAEFPFIAHIDNAAPKVAAKIVRDSVMTTGAAWKSKEAGPNRILRWVMLEDDATLLAYGIDMSQLKPQVVAKLREKAATYDECIEVAMWLTYLVYQMPGAPIPDEFTAHYLQTLFGGFNSGSAVCEICRLSLPFSHFAGAARGKAEVETCHREPRMHNAGNVGFAHRECNIAQGSKSIEEFYAWIEGILHRAQGHS